jgi:hypothetical protein
LQSLSQMSRHMDFGSAHSNRGGNAMPVETIGSL